MTGEALHTLKQRSLLQMLFWVDKKILGSEIFFGSKKVLQVGSKKKFVSKKVLKVGSKKFVGSKEILKVGSKNNLPGCGFYVHRLRILCVLYT